MNLTKPRTGTSRAPLKLGAPGLSPYSSTMPRSLMLLFLSFIFIFIFIFPGAQSATFTIKNNCNYQVWPGILSNAGIPPLPTTGFALDPSQSTTVSVPPGWSGRLWGRTLCSTDPTTSKFTCTTGDCGSSTIQCSGAGATPPATLAEFTLNGANNLDFYDVSLVDGYNLPMLITPQSGGTIGNCSLTGCVVDLNGLCPSELKVMSSESGGGGGEAVACKSACEGFGEPQYCCSGAYGTPATCKPSSYSEFFKNACPRAYSYAYDDKTSIFTCGSGANYIINFCPSSPSPTTSLKSSDSGFTEAAEVEVSVATRITLPYVIGGAISVVVAAIGLYS